MNPTIAPAGRGCAAAGEWHDRPVHSGADIRPAASVGRRARMSLTFSVRRGQTVLSDAYAEPPLRVGRCLPSGSRAYLILASTGPGLFGGDAVEQHVCVERGASVQLVTQSALQIHPADGRLATVRSRLEVEEDGQLDCFWDPVIPFAHARLEQHIDLHVARSGSLFWSDALMAGRAARGEAWRFAELNHELRFTRDGAVEYLERYRLRPETRRVEHAWIADAARYIGTTLVCDERSTPERAGELQQAFAAHEEPQVGVDCLTPGLLVGRVLATRGPDFAKARLAFRALFGLPRARP
jgi:urease accessory protein